MKEDTLCRRLLQLLSLIGLLVLSWTPLMAQGAHMTFTTERNSAATKDWATDSCTVTRSGQTLTIRGELATGNTSYPYQELHMVVTNYTGPGTYALNSGTYFEDLFGSKVVRTTFQAGSITVGFDQVTGKFSGEFSMLLYSNPPNLDPYTTRIYSGLFSVTPTSLVLEAKTTRDTILARAGEKGKVVKVIATDEFGSPVPNVDITLLNPVAGGASVLGNTDAKGEILYTFDVDDDAAAAVYIIKFNGTKVKYNKADELHKVINVTSRYWTYKCGGLELLTFDAGAGNEWKKKPDPSTVLDATGPTVDITVVSARSLLQFSGKMSIDPDRNVVDYDGQLYVPDIPLPGGSTGNLNLNTKPSGELSLNCNSKLKYYLPEVCKAKIGGVTLSLEELELVDLGFANGLKLKVKGEIDKLVTGCNQSNNPSKASIAGAIVISTSPLGIQGWSVEGSNALFFNPYFCLNDFLISYDAPNDTWNASAGIQVKGKLIDDVTKLKGSCTIIKGALDAVSAEFESGICVPIPNVPFCIAGGKVGFSGLSTGFATATGSVNAGLLFKSDEQIVAQKFPGIKKMLGNLELAELNLDGKWSYPKKFSATAALSLLKFPVISVTKPWQIEVSGGLDLDVDKGLVITPVNIKAFHFGANDYFISSTGGKTRFTWDNDYMFEFDMSQATLRIPDVPDAAVDTRVRPFLKYLKGQGLIPLPLGIGRAYISLSVLYGMKAENYVDVTNNPIPFVRRLGKAGFKLECSDLTKSKLIFTISAGGTDLLTIGSIQYRKGGSSIQSAGRELPGPFVAHALDTFVVKPNLERMNIFIEGQSSTPPVAYLIAPNGTRYDATTSDSTIIIDQDTPGDVRWLTVIHPPAGAWILGLVNPKLTDSVTVILPTPAPRTFAVNATSANRTLTVTWNTAGLTADDAVAVHLDNMEGDGGILIGIARGDEGRFEYTFNDNLTECSYKVHAVLSGNDNPPVTANAAGEFATGKTILPPPQNITVLTNTLGEATVTWSPSPDPAVQNYQIYVRGQQMYDSLLAIIPASETAARVVADTALLRTLSIRSSDLDGNVGCPELAASVGFLGVEEERRASTGASMSGVSVMPNPTSGLANIRWVSDQSALTVVEVRNLLGATVARFDLGRSAEGLHEVQWKTDMVAAGTYLVIVHSGATVRSAKVTVVR